jgi:hypothetical protein
MALRTGRVCGIWVLSRFPVLGCCGLLMGGNSDAGTGMLRIIGYGTGVAAVCYLAIVLGVLMSWRQRALREARASAWPR